MLKRLIKNKKGFTLVELIVTMALFSVIGLGAMLLLILTANVFHETSRLTNAQTATLQLIDIIRLDAYASNDVTIISSLPPESERGALSVDSTEFEYYYFENNTLYKVGKDSSSPVAMNISGIAADQSLEYKMTFFDPSPGNTTNVVGIKVEVYQVENPEEIIYSYQTNMEFHNLTQMVEVEGDGSTEEDPVMVEEEQQGVVEDLTGGAGGSCLRFAVPA